MARNYLALFFSVFVSIAGCGFLWLNQSWNDQAEEIARVSRVMLQRAQQNMVRVQQATDQRVLPSLVKDQDSLTVDLAMLIGQLSGRSPGISLSFEQQVLSGFQSAVQNTTINVLALDVAFVVDHAPAALAVLDDITKHIGAWPHEIRACGLFRVQAAGITVNCIVHIYHWPVGSGQVSS